MISITYITDLDIEEMRSIPKSITHFVTLGPMRYWTELLNNELEMFCKKKELHTSFWFRGRPTHRDYDRKNVQIKFHDEDGYERLENPITGARSIRIKTKATMGEAWNSIHSKKSCKASLGSSWDKSIDSRTVIASGKGRHKLFRRTIAEATLVKNQARYSTLVFPIGHGRSRRLDDKETS